MVAGVSDPDGTLAELVDVTGRLGALHARQDALVARAPCWPSPKLILRVPTSGRPAVVRSEQSALTPCLLSGGAAGYALEDVGPAENGD